MGRRGPQPSGAVPTLWSAEVAYAVGLLATDGSLSSDGRHIDLTSVDYSQLVTFKRCLRLKVKIGKKYGSYNKQQGSYRVQFGDIFFYEWMYRIGLTPNKSKTLSKLKIPDKYFFDFLRGCFDGDGSIYAYWDPRWHSSYMFYISFTSASPTFLKWLNKTIERLASVQGKITEARGVSQLRFAKQGTLRIFNRMFYSADIPYLKRKCISSDTYETFRTIEKSCKYITN